jgi:hypothetical protein
LPPGRSSAILFPDITSVRLDSKSIFPPLSIAVLCSIAALSIWGFVGGWSWPIRLLGIYSSFFWWSLLIVFLGLIDAVFRFAFVSLRIDVKDSASVTVRVAQRRSAFDFVQQFESSVKGAGS